MEGRARGRTERTRARKDPEGTSSLAGSWRSDKVTAATLGSPLPGKVLKADWGWGVGTDEDAGGVGVGGEPCWGSGTGRTTHNVLASVS